MIIVLADCGNGYCGCDSEEAFFFEDGTKEHDIDEDIYAWACDNAESYAWVHFGWDEPYTDEDYEDYLENYVSFSWKIVSCEEYVEWCKNWNEEPKVFE